MSDNGATLTVNAQGFVFYGGVRLPIRYEAGQLEFVVGRAREQRRLGSNRVSVPVGEFAKLESSPAPAPRRPAGRMPRERRRIAIAPRNSSVDKSG